MTKEEIHNFLQNSVVFVENKVNAEKIENQLSNFGFKYTPVFDKTCKKYEINESSGIYAIHDNIWFKVAALPVIENLKYKTLTANQIINLNVDDNQERKADYIEKNNESNPVIIPNNPIPLFKVGAEVVIDAFNKKGKIGGIVITQENTIWYTLEGSDFLYKETEIRLKGVLKFKPYDKVLVRDGKGDVWRPTLYSFYDERPRVDTNPHCCCGMYWKDCIPYEGNESLVGLEKDRIV